jgi:predicted N-acetyltransferase YhbS
MIKLLDGHSVPAAVDIYNTFLPAKYRIDEKLLRQKTVECPVFDWGASFIKEGSGFVAVKKSAAKLYRGPNPDSAHITALGYHDPKEMLELLHEVKTGLKNRGVSKLHFGTDSAHLFPGCPQDASGLCDFLMISGFVGNGEAHDLERDLADYDNPAPTPSQDSYRACSADDLPALRDFLAREFPGRWLYDTMEKVAAEGPSTVFALFEGDRCEGFALIQQDGCNKPIGGAVWRESLGEDWGSLGPIGVSKSIRRRGSGNSLLGKALEHLRDHGARRTIIDWTGLVDFYGKHGFEVTRTYNYMTLDLESVSSG